MAYGTIQVDNIQTSSGSLTLGAIGGTVTVSGDLAVNGNFAPAAASGNFIPAADITYDLGSPAARWANIYTGDLHLANERGDWTMIEEDDYLTLRNNKTGKTFKLLMEEIN